MELDDEATNLLIARRALPPWLQHARGWAERYGRNLTHNPGWPELARKIHQEASLTGLELHATETAIAMPDSVPAFLHGMLDSVDVAILRSGDPNDPLRLSWSGIQSAASRLGQVIGSIRDAGMPLFPVPRDPWGPGVIAAAHFCYCHELTHVMLEHRFDHTSPEQEWSKEFQADEIAFAAYALSVRSSPELQELLAFFGPVLALYFGELMELASGSDLDSARASHPPTRSRVMAIRERVRVATSEGLFKANPMPMGDFYSRVLDALLLMLGSVDYPIVSPVEMSLRTLVADVRNSSLDRQRASSNHVLQWYFLADRDRLAWACHRAFTAILREEPDVFELLNRFLDFVRADMSEILKKHDIVEFLETDCLFDKDKWEAAPRRPNC